MKDKKIAKPKEDKKIFADGICWQKLFIIFIIGCLFGNYYEMILNLVRHYLRDGSIFWEVRRGFIYFPLSPVYGAGAVLMTLAFAGKNYKWHQILIYGSILGGSLYYKFLTRNIYRNSILELHKISTRYKWKNYNSNNVSLGYTLCNLCKINLSLSK